MNVSEFDRGYQSGYRAAIDMLTNRILKNVNISIVKKNDISQIAYLLDEKNTIENVVNRKEVLSYLERK